MKESVRSAGRPGRPLRNFEFKFDPTRHGERFKGAVSQTVPDETMTLRQIVERYALGQPLVGRLREEGTFDPLASFDSEDLEKLSKADMVDRQEFIERMKLEAKRATKDIERKESERKRIADAKAKEDREMLEAHRARREEREKGRDPVSPGKDPKGS